MAFILTFVAPFSLNPALGLSIKPCVTNKGVRRGVKKENVFILFSEEKQFYGGFKLTVNEPRCKQENFSSLINLPCFFAGVGEGKNRFSKKRFFFNIFFVGMLHLASYIFFIFK
jgi:hypothetical protein